MAPNYTPMAVTETENGFIDGEDVIIGNVEHSCTIPMIQEIEATYESQTKRCWQTVHSRQAPIWLKPKSEALKCFRPYVKKRPKRTILPIAKT